MNIRNKLFLGISTLVLLFILLSIFFNQTFLLSFYIRETQSKLLIAAKGIDLKYRGNITGILADLMYIEWNSGIHIEILDSKLDLKYMTENRGPGPKPSEGNQPPVRPPFEKMLLLQLKSTEPGNYIFQNNIHPNLMIRFFEMGYILNNGDFIILSRPLAALEESAGVANRFLMLSGLIICAIGIFTVYIFSRRFTKPIIELRDMAQSMSELNFNHKFTIRSHDEIAELGKSINSLSGQLDRSINELRLVNKKLREDIDRERKLEEMRKDFVSSVSHELKTPIALIQGYAEGLKEGVAKKQDRDYYCNVIIDESRKMDRLLQDLLNLSQYESGIFKLNIRKFDLKELMEKILQKYSPLIHDKKIQLEMIAEHVEVQADPSRIEQVIMNFLNNAADHCEGEKWIQICIKGTEDNATFTIFNSGKPIPEDALEKIWFRFYKTDPSRNRSYGGTGLGLAVVKAILELHNASFGVKNLSDGVEFWFELKKTFQS